MKKYGLNPLWLVSLKGFYGMLISFLIIPLLSYIDCPFSHNSACVINDDGEAVVEHAGIYFREICENNILFIGFLLVTLCQAFFSSTSVMIAQKISSLARAVVDVSRTVLIWFGGVVITATIGASNPTYRW